MYVDIGGVVWKRVIFHSSASLVVSVESLDDSHDTTSALLLILAE